MERSTSREPLTDEDVAGLLSRASRVLVARGKKVFEQPAAEVDLHDLRGRSGTYRAPIVLAGDTLIVGFNEEVMAGL